MPGSSNSSSFIPKRGTKKHTRKIRNLNIYILTVISYVLFFAALAASAAVFFYSRSITGQLNNEIATMSAAVSNFKEADMQRVDIFDVRLRQANQRLNNSASVTQILTEVESAVIDTVRLTKFSLERNFDEGYIVQAEAETDIYDSAIFQRDILEEYDVVEEIEIRDVALRQISGEQEQIAGQSISLQALLSIPLEAVAYSVDETGMSTTPVEVLGGDEVVDEVETTEVVENETVESTESVDSNNNES